MVQRLTIQPDASSLRAGIVHSRYHGWATDRLLDGAIERWRLLGGRDENLLIVPAAGAWELPAVALALAQRPDLDAVVVLGVIIRGETEHHEHLARGVTQGLMEIMTRTGVPVGLGVLTCDTPEQAKQRSGGETGNKGVEAMSAAVEAALTIRSIRAGRSTT